MDLIINIVEFLVTLILIPCVGKVINIVVDTFIGDNKLSMKKVIIISLFFTIFLAIITIFIFSEEILFICVMLPLLILFAIYIFNYKKINMFFQKSYKFFCFVLSKTLSFTRNHKIISFTVILSIIVILLLKFLLNVILFPICLDNDLYAKKHKYTYTIVVKNLIPYVPKKLTEIPPAFYKDNSLIYTIKIPDHVTVIRSGAFKNCPNLKKVIIGKNVKLIEDEAFANCKNLTDVKFNNDIEFIMGNDIFLDCIQLKYITLPNTLIETGQSIFNGCLQLKSVKLPCNKKFNTLEAYFFGNCKELSSIKTSKNKINVLPNNIENIGCGAFYNCNNLRQLDFNQVKTIEAGAFMFCGLEKIVLNNVENIYLQTFANCPNVERIIIPKVKNIDEFAFYDCNKLKYINFDDLNNIDFGNSFENIGSFAFYNCGFENFNISNNLKKIDDCAFLKCNNLKKFKINNNKFFTIDEYNALLSKDKTELICLPSGINKYKISEKITNIRNGAIAYLNKDSDITLDIKNKFYKCDNLGIYKDNTIVCIFPNKNDSFISFDKEKTEIGPFAAIGSNLKQVDILYTGITKISDYAFYECLELKLISLPLSLNEIGNYTFYRCKKLSSLDIPYNVKEINNSTFANCTNLKNINLSPETISIGAKAFSKTKIDNIDLPNSIINIGSGAFANCKYLKNIKIPNKIKDLPNDIFNDSNNLKYIEIPETLEILNIRKYFEEENIKCKIKKYRIETEEKLNL